VASIGGPGGPRPAKEAKRTRRKKGGGSAEREGEVFRAVAHDLKTPLVAIQGFAQLLEISGRDGGLNERQRKYVDCILQAARSMNAILDEMGSRYDTAGSKND
jgi:signal transduction histidine kinase